VAKLVWLDVQDWVAVEVAVENGVVHRTGAISESNSMILEHSKHLLFLRNHFMDGHRLNAGYSITSGSTDPPVVAIAR
jgi:hypothetical protein